MHVYKLAHNPRPPPSPAPLPPPPPPHYIDMRTHTHIFDPPSHRGCTAIHGVYGGNIPRRTSWVYSNPWGLWGNDPSPQFVGVQQPRVSYDGMILHLSHRYTGTHDLCERWIICLALGLGFTVIHGVCEGITILPLVSLIWFYSNPWCQRMNQTLGLGFTVSMASVKESQSCRWFC